MKLVDKWVGKYHYVVWSGGLDSTYLLDRVARLYSTQNQQIYTISIIYPEINKQKESMEKKARNRFMKYAKKKGYNIEQYFLDISEAPPMQTGGLCQAILWMFLGLPFIWNGSVMHFGYIKGDDFWHHSNHFDTVFEVFKKVSHRDDIEIAYDLEYTKKCNILGEIPEDLYWYCEAPKKVRKKIVPCGECCCCITHKMAEYEKNLKESDK